MAALALTVFRKNLISPSPFPTKQLHTLHTHSHISGIWLSLQQARTKHDMAHDLTPHPRRHRSRSTLVQPETQHLPLHNRSTLPMYHSTLCLHYTHGHAPHVTHTRSVQVAFMHLSCLHAQHTVKRVDSSGKLSEPCAQTTALACP